MIKCALNDIKGKKDDCCALTFKLCRGSKSILAEHTPEK